MTEPRPIPVLHEHYYQCPHCGSRLVAQPYDDTGPTLDLRCPSCTYRWEE